jgi:hypothetical protein
MDCLSLEVVSSTSDIIKFNRRVVYVFPKIYNSLLSSSSSLWHVDQLYKATTVKQRPRNFNLNQSHVTQTEHTIRDCVNVQALGPIFQALDGDEVTAKARLRKLWEGCPAKRKGRGKDVLK